MKIQNPFNFHPSGSTAKYLITRLHTCLSTKVYLVFNLKLYDKCNVFWAKK